jgi:membrane protein DedA with SNARE-associated domain
MTAHLVLATATADKPQTLLILFIGVALSWAGVPALGTAALGAAGALASQGDVRLWAVLVVGTLGSELGGLGGWWLGKHVVGVGLDTDGGRFVDRRRSAMEGGRHFAERWGKFMVFFVPSWVPGALAVPLRTFAVWNFLAAALWTLGASLSAYGITEALKGKSFIHTVVPIAIAVLALTAIGVLGFRRRRRRASVRPAPESEGVA